MVIIGFCGAANSGKTTLLCKVIPLLTAKGLKVAAIKHHGHASPIVEPAVMAGKDSAALAAAGASRVALAHSAGVSMTAEAELALAGPAELAQGLMRGMDLVLVEGYKRAELPKVEVVAGGKLPVLAPQQVAAYATPGGKAAGSGTWLDADRPEEVADFILQLMGKAPA